ncbi:MAG: DUF1648 domain-containing protein [Christensenellaceae bacterium]|nr:DUF1648 domain-containing protein [Christensenellaceae bacterium]
MNKYKTLIITTILCLLPMFIGLIIYNGLPQQIPNKYNLQGEIIGYASKAQVIILQPLILTAINFFMHFMINNSPRMRDQSKVVLNIIAWFIPVLSLIVFSFQVFGAKFYGGNINKLVNIGLGLVFIIIGNYMPKFKRNYIMGIKIPWTLDNEENWNKTHRLAGFIWVIGGILFVVFTIFNLRIISAISFAVMILIPIIYSYLIYKKQNGVKNNEK